MDAFYDSMERDDRYRPIWDLHPDANGVSRDKLTRFLCARMGGPRPLPCRTLPFRWCLIYSRSWRCLPNGSGNPAESSQSGGIDTQDQFVRPNLCILGCGQLAHGTGHIGKDLVLHLHSFQHRQLVTPFHRVSLSY